MMTVHTARSILGPVGVMSMEAVNYRVRNLPGILHPELRNEPVVQELLRAVGATVYNTHQNNIVQAQLNAGTAHGLTAIQVLENYSSAPATAASLSSQPRDLNYGDFMSFGAALRHALLELAGSSIPATPLITSDTITESDQPEFSQAQFNKAFVYYFNAYIKGNFYPRFGKPLPVPTTLQTISDNEIAGSVQVFLELLLDYALRTPVWSVTDKTSKVTTYYPGGGTGKTTPTVISAAAGGLVPIPIDSFVTDTRICGMT